MTLPRILRSPSAATALSVLFIVLMSPPVGLAWLFIWFILVPWLGALERVSSLRKALLQAVWLSFLFNMTIYGWAAFALHEFAGLPWALSILVLALAATVSQPQFIFFGALYRWIWERRWLNADRPGRMLIVSCFLSFAYTGFDWILPKMFLDTLGHGFVFMRNFRQVADLGGAHLLTFLAVMVNLLVRGLWRGRSLRPLLPQALLCTALVVGFWGYGVLRSREVARAIDGAKLSFRAGAIQANIPNVRKLAAEMGVNEAMDGIIKGFQELSARALADSTPPHLVVWPETAFPMYFDSPRSLQELEREREFRRYVSGLPVPLVMGSYEKASPDKDYNSMIFFPRDAEKRVSYRKHVLLHFGDYIPGESLFPSVRRFAPKAVGRYLAGDGPAKVPLDLAIGTGSERVEFLPIICYEAIFPSYVRRGALLGPDVILNITNDSWFGPIGEPQLHLALSAFRSIETRLPQLRVTNTGISALILPDGEITGATGLDEAVWRNYEVPVTRGLEPTLFVRWGDWFGLFSLGMALLLGASLAATDGRGASEAEPSA